MDKRALSNLFRIRLTELVSRSGLSHSAFAAEIGIDRSALSQLLSSDSARLPRVETLLNIAERHSVSLDWRRLHRHPPDEMACRGRRLQDTLRAGPYSRPAPHATDHRIRGEIRASKRQGASKRNGIQARLQSSTRHGHGSVYATRDT